MSDLQGAAGRGTAGQGVAWADRGQPRSANTPNRSDAMTALRILAALSVATTTAIVAWFWRHDRWPSRE